MEELFSARETKDRGVLCCIEAETPIHFDQFVSGAVRALSSNGWSKVLLYCEHQLEPAFAGRISELGEGETRPPVLLLITQRWERSGRRVKQRALVSISSTSVETRNRFGDLAPLDAIGEAELSYVDPVVPNEMFFYYLVGAALERAVLHALESRDRHLLMSGFPMAVSVRDQHVRYSRLVPDIEEAIAA